MFWFGHWFGQLLFGRERNGNQIAGAKGPVEKFGLRSVGTEVPAYLI
jgi:hypothetical protein